MQRRQSSFRDKSRFQIMGASSKSLKKIVSFAKNTNAAQIDSKKEDATNIKMMQDALSDPGFFGNSDGAGDASSMKLQSKKVRQRD